jgi:CarD family transcriptional regulator
VKLGNSKVKLQEGMMLYCASHGPGKVVKIESKEYFGEKITFCEMKFEKDDMKILTPISKMNEMGIRTIISKESAKKILDTVLNRPAKCSKGIWTKRIVECETKLYSGSATLIAEVVRDLFAGMKDPNKSYGERVLFDKAFDRLVLEFSIAMGITIEEANKEILDVLNAQYNSSHKNDVVKDKEMDADDFTDDDIEDIADEDDSDDEDEKPKKKTKTA